MTFSRLPFRGAWPVRRVTESTPSSTASARFPTRTSPLFHPGYMKLSAMFTASPLIFWRTFCEILVLYGIGAQFICVLNVFPQFNTGFI
jgi:hypothetical protein